jgi:hypothetical protein
MQQQRKVSCDLPNGDENRLNGSRKEIVYFGNPGEINTDSVISVSKKRALELGVRKVLIASDTGRSALKAASVFSKTEIQLVAVTTPPCTTWGPKGDLPSGIVDEKVREKLGKYRVVIVQATPPFFSMKRLGETLELFGAGTKIAVQIAVMATDAGIVKEGEEVISMAGTYKGLDTALVLKGAICWNLLSKFEVLEIIAKPRSPKVSLPEYNDPKWKGDIQKYYRPISQKL